MVVEHHAYGPARSQFGELFLPGGDGPHPVAVVLHGGFWRAQHGCRQTRPLCRDLAARGWAAWNVEYRRLGRLSGGGASVAALKRVAGAARPAHPFRRVRRTAGGLRRVDRLGR